MKALQFSSVLVSQYFRKNSALSPSGPFTGLFRGSSFKNMHCVNTSVLPDEGSSICSPDRSMVLTIRQNNSVTRPVFLQTRNVNAEGAPESKQGTSGIPFNCVTNMFRVAKRPQWQLYQYRYGRFDTQLIYLHFWYLGIQ